MSWKRRLWDIGIPIVASNARRRPRVSRALTRALAVLTLAIQRGRPRRGAARVGDEWQRMFPNPEMVPIREVDERTETVRAEIRSPCPLRGTGDVDACHRMMEYDRRMLERIGGQLVVLASQAEPGRTFCEVAIRPAGVSVDDLEAAHVRVRRTLPVVAV